MYPNSSHFFRVAVHFPFFPKKADSFVMQARQVIQRAMCLKFAPFAVYPNSSHKNRVAVHF